MAENLHAGDTVFMDVAAEDYNNKAVSVYSIKCNGRDWLTLADYCKEANSHFGAGVVIILFFGFVSLALCALLWQKIKAWRGNVA